jgi:hypothetical protein
MTVKLTMPQANLLSEIQLKGDKGVIKSMAYTPANVLVSSGFATWARRYNNGATGLLVITERGKAFKRGEL